MLLSWVSKYDGRGTAAARKDFAKLGKTAVSTQLTVAGLTYAFGRLAQASIQAAMAEQQSLTQVNKALENAGFRNATTQVDEFIVSLQNATGIVKKELRPAFLTLFNATGDVGASQEALRKALDIVAGTGKDLSTVVTALSRAYSGNRESLNELNTGLDKTLLKTGSLVEIMAELDRKFKGQAAAASATLTAQFLQLQLGIDKVTQAFGKGFIEELRISEVDVSKFADAMYNLGQFLGMVTNKVTNLTGSLTDLKQWFIDFARGPLGMSKWLQKSVVDPIGTLRDSISSMPAAAGGGSALEQYLKRIQKMQDAAAAKANAEARKTEAQRKKAAALDAKTKELAQKFDLELIGLAAAKKRQVDEETMVRLTALQALAQQGYNSESNSIEDLDRLLKKLAASQQAYTDSINASATAWTGVANAAAAAQQAMSLIQSGKPSQVIAGGNIVSNSLADLMGQMSNFQATLPPAAPGVAAPTPPSVTVINQGPIIGADDIDQMVQNAVNRVSRSGGRFGAQLFELL